MEFWIGWFHEHSLGRDVAEIARVIEATGFKGVGLSDHIAIPKAHESLHPVIQTGLDPLVPNVEPFTTAAYLGVDGMVVMAWPIHSPEFISASARIEALEKFSEKWIV